MADIPKPRRPIWQFSLRETLLLTAVVALVLSHVARAWFYESHGLSPFYEQFDPIAWSQLLAQRNTFSKRTAGGGGSESHQVYGVKRYQLALAPSGRSPSREQYLAEFQRLANQALAAAKCAELNNMTNGEPAMGFAIEYTWRGNRGSLEVQSFPLPNGEYGLFVTLHEARMGR